MENQLKPEIITLLDAVIARCNYTDIEGIWTLCGCGLCEEIAAYRKAMKTN